MIRRAFSTMERTRVSRVFQTASELTPDEVDRAIGALKGNSGRMLADIMMNRQSAPNVLGDCGAPLLRLLDFYRSGQTIPATMVQPLLPLSAF